MAVTDSTSSGQTLSFKLGIKCASETAPVAFAQEWSGAERLVVGRSNDTTGGVRARCRSLLIKGVDGRIAELASQLFGLCHARFVLARLAFWP